MTHVWPGQPLKDDTLTSDTSSRRVPRGLDAKEQLSLTESGALARPGLVLLLCGGLIAAVFMTSNDETHCVSEPLSNTSRT